VPFRGFTTGDRPRGPRMRGVASCRFGGLPPETNLAAT